VRVIASFGKEDLATVYLGEIANGSTIEFVESVQPPVPRDRKWVLIVSTMCGCPVKCMMCDAGGNYRGSLSTEEIVEQIDYMVVRRFPDRVVPIPKFKVQFARMGEPALNRSVLEVLEMLPGRYEAVGLMPCVSTIAPSGADSFFEPLLGIKERLYPGGKFQLQFSVHTTDEELRDRLIPASKWSLEKIASYGDRFFREGDRKITLNFAPGMGASFDREIIRRLFSPDKFLIKITPINPTYTARANQLISYIDPHRAAGDYENIEELRDLGYDVLLSIGELEENLIGSNCGQYVMKYMQEGKSLDDGYRSYQYRKDR
jgi:23S rRNA (adenine2503-C2)-methyltransferase